MIQRDAVINERNFLQNVLQLLYNHCEHSVVLLQNMFNILLNSNGNGNGRQ